MGDVLRYRILESVGRGEMGEVFLADDIQRERKVATSSCRNSCGTTRLSGRADRHDRL